MTVPYAEARRAGDKVVVPKCPRCGKSHEHPYAQSSGVRECASGKGPYRIILSLGNVGASPGVETKPESPRAKTKKRGFRRA